jgi:hypothetical protein
MALTQFDAPGFLDDLDANGKKLWSQWISTQIDDARNVTDDDAGQTNYGPRLQFFNPLTTPPDADAQEKDVTWTAFPRLVQLQAPGDQQRWKRADASRDVQDEYSEWSVTRNPAGKIIKVTFTSEAPEYWEFLAKQSPDKVLELYRKHVSSAVAMADLFVNGKYAPRNKWNNSTTGGAMHLIQSNNSLGAEIELAAASTIVRKVNGKILTGEQELITCGRYGQAERHSDPHIGAVVNALARAKADITLANPVGLCIAGLSVAGWAAPDGSNPLDYWTIVRGTKEKALRAVYEVPESKGFVVGDIQINGRKIDFASQITDFITIKLTGLATRIGKSTVPPAQGCVASKPVTEAIAAERPKVRPSRV